ncbi:cytochrome c [Pigmentiphaga litoralis]|jgi:ubiquinol-cytochrome c reductase cytochrome c1 subunit|uniref:cytochrome c1 n=1 Tax=Pigmentiphaga litoralis TaxID=516702 RepID=UPI001676B11E|nr:cytochrome c1 [Pigmentiphaga litoralis]GGX19839.1 cytochrome c [Pigmentiphaga litoralis]
MKKLLGALILMLTCSGAYAAEGGFPLDTAPFRSNDLSALQNGAKLFVNNCLNCHSASSMRYNRLRDIGLTDEQIAKNLLFTGEKVGDLMTVAMTPKDAKTWFGAAPPDLSVIARAKSVNAGPSGSDYIYTYLRTFYRDQAQATGWNNLVFPSVAMPHVLWQEQGPHTVTTVAMHAAEGEHGWERITTVHDENGVPTVTREPVPNYHGHESSVSRIVPKNPVQAAAFDNQVADLVAFMTWMSEPAAQQRTRLGVWVLLFLAVFTIIAWRLNSVYWKDIK